MKTQKAAWPLVGLALLLFASPSFCPARTWTNTDGQTIEAEFVRMRGRTAILKTGDRTVPAPINRLSEADNAWIVRYKELMSTRDWGKPDATTYRGRYSDAKNGKVQVKYGSTVELVPYEELSEADWRYVDELLTHLDQEMPEDLLAFKPVEPIRFTKSIDPDEAVERTWTDVRGREIVAAYLGVEGDAARLWLKEKEYKYPLARLSAADRAWVAKQNLSGLTDGLQLVNALAAQAMVRAQTQGGPPPMPTPQAPNPGFNQQQPNQFAQTDPALYGGPPQPQPVEQPVEPDPAPPIETSVANDEPLAEPAGKQIDNIRELSDDEYEARYAAAMEGYPEVDWDDPYGDVYCNQCQADFAIPEGFAAGQPCPFCNDTISSRELTVYSEIKSSSRPWYMSRGIRRLVIGLVLTGLIAGVKLAMGGGE